MPTQGARAGLGGKELTREGTLQKRVFGVRQRGSSGQSNLRLSDPRHRDYDC